jgi:hypothetical protein
VLAIQQGITPASKSFSVIIVAEVDVPNIRVNPSAANLEDFYEVICTDCIRFDPLSPASHDNRGRLGCRVAVLRKRASRTHGERKQNERNLPHRHLLDHNSIWGKQAGALYHHHDFRQSLAVVLAVP